jgi:hypothetical protein
VNANRRLDTAMPTSAAALADYRHAPACPIQEPGGRARTRNPPTDGRAPHRQPRNRSRKEVNRMRRPSLKELRRQLEEDSGCEATDGCFVEPDGTCDHGQRSWLLVLGLI